MERKTISEINFQSMQQAHVGNNPQFPVICTRVRATTFKVVEYERKEEHRYVLIIFSWQCIFLRHRAAGQIFDTDCVVAADAEHETDKQCQLFLRCLKPKNCTNPLLWSLFCPFPRAKCT